MRELAAHAEVSDAVMRGLVNAGALERVEVDGDAPLPRPRSRFRPAARSTPSRPPPPPVLTAAIGKGFDPVLLDGVTGSGKTEVYFEAIAEALRQGRQALVLLPEIALTEPFLTRFTARFGCEPVAWHSRPALLAAPPRLAGDCQRRGARSWSARARPCSCPMPTSA